MRRAILGAACFTAIGCGSGETPPLQYDTPLTFVTGVHPNGITSGDFDGDGDPDIAVPGVVTAQLTVLWNRGNGFDWMLADNIPPATDAAAIDIDGDGRDELLLGSYESSGGVLLRHTDANSWYVMEAITGEATYLATHDVDGDGDLDAVASRFNGDEVAILENRDGHLVAGRRIPANRGPQGVAVYESEGLVHIAVVAAGAETLQVFDETAAWEQAQTIPTGGWPLGVAVADLGDGPVVVFANNLSGSITITGNAVYEIAAGEGAADVAAADLDGDGDNDVVVANKFADTITVFRNDEGVLTPLLWLETRPGPTSLLAIDFDGNGRPDIAVANAFDDSVSVFMSR